MRLRLAVLSYLPPSPTVVKSGMGTVSYALCAHLKKAGIEVRILAAAIGSSSKEDLIDGIPLHKAGRPYTVQAPLLLTRLRPKFQFDVVHSFTAASFLCPLITKTAFGTPFISHYQGAPQNLQVVQRDTRSFSRLSGPSSHGGSGSLKASIFHGWILARRKLFFKSSDTVVSGSKFTMRDAVEKYGVSEKKARVIYNGVDTQLFQPRGDRQRVTHRLLYVGRLSLEKGVQDIIEALPSIVHEFPDTKLIVAGPKRDAYEPLVRFARELGVQNRVEFIGYFSPLDLPALYNSAELFVQPCLYESLGMTVLEAMACGTPVLASDAGSVSEVVTNDVSGFLFRPGSSSQLATRVSDIFSNPAHLAEVALESRRIILRSFTWERCVGQFASLYQELLH